MLVHYPTSFCPLQHHNCQWGKHKYNSPPKAMKLTSDEGLCKSTSQRRNLQHWVVCDGFVHTTHFPQFSFRRQPVHCPHRFLLGLLKLPLVFEGEIAERPSIGDWRPVRGRLGKGDLGDVILNGESRAAWGEVREEKGEKEPGMGCQPKGETNGLEGGGGCTRYAIGTLVPRRPNGVTALVV